MFTLTAFFFVLFVHLSMAFFKELDICDLHNSRKLYVEFGSSGELIADFQNHALNSESANRLVEYQQKCAVELITCPSCVIHIKFKYLNTTRACNQIGLFSDCGCDYVLVYEPSLEQTSGERFCSRYTQNKAVEMTYYSRTRSTSVTFFFHGNYGHAFTLEFSAIRNQQIFEGFPTVKRMNNDGQFIMSPFFPKLYPADLSTEYVIQCHSKIPCRISLIFTDFLMADSSILEFFDWNGQRLYVISGNTFRPPVIITSGPTLVVRFYANGASNLGFKAAYGFTLGNLDDVMTRTNTDCGGQVNNLGGGITMMNMTAEGTKFYDCLWIIQMPINFLHRKTHLYVKVVNFTNFAGPTELILRKGLTSSQAAIDILKFPATSFGGNTETEHVVPISEGFYVSLRGLFKAESRVAIVYAAFNYKECFSGLDFLCHNMRCISALLNCDGFDHCGDNSDESPDCSEDPRDHREFSKIPNFRFPKVEPYSDLTMATVVFLLCTFGLIGIIIAMTLLLYRVNMRARHHRQIQDHIETIHAILEEGVSEAEEEIIVPDEPPDYEPPPEYSDVLKYIRKVACGNRQKNRLPPTFSKPSQSFIATSSVKSSTSERSESGSRSSSTSRSSQTLPLRLLEAPPPAYDHVRANAREFSSESDQEETGGASRALQEDEETARCFPRKMFTDIGTSLRQNIRKYKTTVFARNFNKNFSFSHQHLVRHFSDSDLVGKAQTGGVEVRKLGKRSFSASELF